MSDTATAMARPRAAELALLLSRDGVVLESGESLLALVGPGVNPLGVQFHTLLHPGDRDQVKQLTRATGETVLLRLRSATDEWQPYQAWSERWLGFSDGAHGRARAPGELSAVAPRDAGPLHVGVRPGSQHAERVSRCGRLVHRQALRAGHAGWKDLRDPHPDSSSGKQAMRSSGTACGARLQPKFRRPSGAPPGNRATAAPVAS
jgi:hypothetical protein